MNCLQIRTTYINSTAPFRESKARGSTRALGDNFGGELIVFTSHNQMITLFSIKMTYTILVGRWKSYQ